LRLVGTGIGVKSATRRHGGPALEASQQSASELSPPPGGMGARHLRLVGIGIVGESALGGLSPGPAALLCNVLEECVCHNPRRYTHRKFMRIGLQQETRMCHDKQNPDFFIIKLNF
jgi:hypothetical protein